MEMKQKFPKVKLSVRCDHNAIEMRLMAAPFDAFSDKAEESKIAKGYTQLNKFYLDRHDDLTPEALEVMKHMLKFSDKFNWDNSDSMTDYFDVNFYAQLSIGEWDRPFVNTAK